MALKKSEWHRNPEKSFLKFAYAIFYSIRNIFERTMAKGKKQRKQGQDSDSEWVKMALFSKFQNPRIWKSQEEAAVEHFTRGLHTRISLIMRFFHVKAIINLCKNCWIVKNQGSTFLSLRPKSIRGLVHWQRFLVGNCILKT